MSPISHQRSVVGAPTSRMTAEITEIVVTGPTPPLRSVLGRIGTETCAEQGKGRADAATAGLPDTRRPIVEYDRTMSPVAGESGYVPEN